MRMTRDEQLHEQARRAFKNHVIRKRDDKSGRWVLQKPYEDEEGGWRSEYWTEIVSLEGGMIYVGGDIDFVIFAYYSDKRGDHQAKIRWMGEHSDFSYYVHQKACIGTGNKLIDVWDEEAAKEAVRGWLNDLDEDDDHDKRKADKVREMLDDDWLDWQDERSVIEKIAETLGADWMCDVGSGFGMVIHPRLHFAYAALKRLIAIWDAQEEIWG